MGGFTFEDHSTAQHLMGMRTSTSPPYAAPRVPSSVTAGFPRIHLAEYETKRLQLEQQLIGRKPTAPAVRPPTVHSMSNMPNLGNLIRMSTAAPPQQRDARAPEMDESERLKLELPDDIDIEPIPEDKSTNDLLLAGELDAIISPTPPDSFVDGHENVRELLGGIRETEKAFHTRTGTFPIMHTVAT